MIRIPKMSNLSMSAYRRSRQLNAFEIVAVELLHDIRFVIGNANTVVNHVLGELIAVDQHDAKVGLAGGVSCSRSETATSDEYALRCLVLAERPNEFPDRSGANVRFVALGLNVYHVEAEPVFFDNAVN